MPKGVTSLVKSNTFATFREINEVRMTSINSKRTFLSRGTSIGKSVAALTLLFVFLVPSLAHFSHIFEEDDHVVCSERMEHIHQVASDCPVCHFQLASFPYEMASYPEFVRTAIPMTVEKKYTSLMQRFFLQTCVQLRAPPHLSV